MVEAASVGVAFFRWPEHKEVLYNWCCCFYTWDFEGIFCVLTQQREHLWGCEFYLMSDQWPGKPECCQISEWEAKCCENLHSSVAILQRFYLTHFPVVGLFSCWVIWLEKFQYRQFSLGPLAIQCLIGQTIWMTVSKHVVINIALYSANLHTQRQENSTIPMYYICDGG